MRRLVTLRAPDGTLGPANDGLASRIKAGHLKIRVHFYGSAIDLIIKPSTKVSRLRRACQRRFGVAVRLAFAGRPIDAGEFPTAESLDLVEGSQLSATELVSETTATQNVAFWV